MTLTIAGGTSPEWTQLARSYWEHTEDEEASQVIAWMIRLADFPLPAEAPANARRSAWISRNIAAICTARIRRKCPECGKRPVITSRKAAEERLRYATDVGCDECVGQQTANARAARQAAVQAQYEQAVRRRANVTTLPVVVGGGDLHPVELTLAQAMLLYALVSNSDEHGVIGPAETWAHPPAKLGIHEPARDAWSRLWHQRILLPHPSSHVNSFTWKDNDLIDSLYLDQVRWYVPLGPEGVGPAESCELAKRNLAEAFAAKTWPGGWSLDASTVAESLIMAEGLHYFLYGLDKRQFPHPKDEKYEQTCDALIDAAKDFSISKIHYLTWKPLQDASDACRRNYGMTTDAATRHAVNQMANRAPRFREMGWEAREYNQPADLPLAEITVILFRSLGLDPMKASAVAVAEAARDRAPESDLDQEAFAQAEEQLLTAETLPEEVWEQTLKALEATTRQDPGSLDDDPPGSEAYFALLDAARAELAATTLEYLRAARIHRYAEPAQLLAATHLGAPLAAHAITRRLTPATASSAEFVDVSVTIAADLQCTLVETFQRATQTPKPSESDR